MRGGTLIRKGLAYVDDLQGEEVSRYRGRWDEPGRDSPYRDRPVEENLDLFARMRAGEFEDGARTLRAKIDMAAPNMNMRDPTIYRIRRSPHYRQGDDWVVYPTYDFTHPLSDAFERITHSLCTLEFEDHRPLYDWYLQALDFENPPRQIEFARLNLTYTVLSKRKLLELVEGKHVEGWDDPRMPTLAGMRRRGYPPAAIRDFCGRIGVAKANSVVQMAQLEDAVRQELNRTAPRVMAVTVAAEGGHRELPGRPRRRTRSDKQPGRPQCRHAQGSVLARALHRGRGLRGEPTKEVLPPCAGAGGSSPLRLFPDLPRRGQGR